MNEGLGELRVSKTLFYNGDEENGYHACTGIHLTTADQRWDALRASRLCNGRMVVEENKYDLSGGNPGQNLAGRQKM